MLRRGLLGGLGVLLLGRLPARAQSSLAPMTWYQNGIMRQQILNGWSARERARAAQAQGGPPAAAPTAPAPRAAPPGNTSAPGAFGLAGSTGFRPVAPAILPGMLAAQQAGTAEERAALERYYRTNLDYTARLFQARGRPANDLGVALAYYLLVSYAVAADVQEPVASREATARFIAALQQAVRADPAIQALDDRGRQTLYEELILTPMALSDALDLAKRNNRPAAGQQARAQARRNIEEFFGVPFGQVAATEAGLVGR